MKGQARPTTPLLLVALVVGLTASLAAARAVSSYVLHSTGVVSGVTPGVVVPVGATGRWLVQGREVRGRFVDGGLAGLAYTLSYDASVESGVTQEGRFHGALALSDGSEATVVGETHALTLAEVGDGRTLPRLDFSGRWSFQRGRQGHGDVVGWAVLAPVEDGTGGRVVEGGIVLRGTVR